MTDVVSIDPRTGREVEVVAPETSTAEVDRLCSAARLDLDRLDRADLLVALADALEARRDDIVGLADRETALGPTRLNGELTRTAYQLRFFAEVLGEGSYLEAAIDHAGDTPMGPRPDLRRMLVPLGPVAVFGASNFPLAFSVPGGDTASALAAGCPVVIKAHASHPATSQLCFEIMAAVAPAGALALVHGLQAGADLVGHPRIRAVGFTGSLGGGRALVRLIEQRADPIPFFGELSSLNPVVVTTAAAGARGAEIGAELVGSFTLGGGQFCTKPGLAFVPSGPDGDVVVAAMADGVRALGPQVLLNAGIAASFGEASERLAGLLEPIARAGTDAGSGTPAPTPTPTPTPAASPAAGLRPPAWTGGGSAGGFRAAPLLLAGSAATLPAEAFEECFGPVAVVARYADAADLDAAIDRLPSSLTATVLHAADESPVELSRRLLTRAGRIVHNGYPTGVAVSWAQHHGGPWPSTNSQHTSVGASSIRRFLRPVTWQNAPYAVLPPELRDGPVDLPRRVDGTLVLP
jgi:NADP-dependent aldehyde dehydrogenase